MATRNLTRRRFLAATVLVPIAGRSALADIEFAERSYWFSAGGPFPQGGHAFMTDMTAQVSGNPGGVTFHALPLPTWFPKQSLISRFALGWGAATPTIDGGIVNYVAWIDPRGMEFTSAGGAQVGSDPSRDIPLVQGFKNLQFLAETQRFDHPVPFDRSTGDRLVLEFGSSYDLDWVYASITILVPAPFQPQPLAGY